MSCAGHMCRQRGQFLKSFVLILEFGWLLVSGCCSLALGGRAQASLSHPLLLPFVFQVLVKKAMDRCLNASLSGKEALRCGGNPGAWEHLRALSCPHDSTKSSVFNELLQSAEDAVSSRLLISSADSSGLILQVRHPSPRHGNPATPAPSLLRPHSEAARHPSGPNLLDSGLPQEHPELSDCASPPPLVSGLPVRSIPGCRRREARHITSGIGQLGAQSHGQPCFSVSLPLAESLRE